MRLKITTLVHVCTEQVISSAYVLRTYSVHVLCNAEYLAARYAVVRDGGRLATNGLLCSVRSYMYLFYIPNAVTAALRSAPMLQCSAYLPRVCLTGGTQWLSFSRYALVAAPANSRSLLRKCNRKTPTPKHAGIHM